MKKFIIVFIILLYFCVGCNKQNEAVIYGEPDVINSTSFNKNQYLNLIANKPYINDKYAFAEEIIQMCKNNSFHTIKFSYDKSYPTGIYIDVYLNKDDFDAGKKFMKIEYSQNNEQTVYNVFDNPEKFKLLIN